MNDYIVNFTGKLIIEAETEMEAEEKAYDRLRELGAYFQLEKADFQGKAGK